MSCGSHLQEEVVVKVEVGDEEEDEVSLLLLEAADGEGVLGDLHQHKVSPLPLLPHGLAHRVQPPEGGNMQH